jgi:hypothetical protein
MDETTLIAMSKSGESNGSYDYDHHPHHHDVNHSQSHSHSRSHDDLFYNQHKSFSVSIDLLVPPASSSLLNASTASSKKSLELSDGNENQHEEAEGEMFSLEVDEREATDERGEEKEEDENLKLLEKSSFQETLREDSEEDYQEEESSTFMLERSLVGLKDDDDNNNDMVLQKSTFVTTDGGEAEKDEERKEGEGEEEEEEESDDNESVHLSDFMQSPILKKPPILTGFSSSSSSSAPPENEIITSSCSDDDSLDSLYELKAVLSPNLQSQEEEEEQSSSSSFSQTISLNLFGGSATKSVVDRYKATVKEEADEEEESDSGFQISSEMEITKSKEESSMMMTMMKTTTRQYQTTSSSSSSAASSALMFDTTTFNDQRIFSEKGAQTENQKNVENGITSISFFQTEAISSQSKGIQVEKPLLVDSGMTTDKERMPRLKEQSSQTSFQEDKEKRQPEKKQEIEKEENKNKMVITTAVFSDSISREEKETEEKRLWTEEDEEYTEQMEIVQLGLGERLIALDEEREEEMKRFQITIKSSILSSIYQKPLLLIEESEREEKEREERKEAAESSGASVTLAINEKELLEKQVFVLQEKILQFEKEKGILASTMHSLKLTQETENQLKEVKISELEKRNLELISLINGRKKPSMETSIQTEAAATTRGKKKSSSRKESLLSMEEGSEEESNEEDDSEEDELSRLLFKEQPSAITSFNRSTIGKMEVFPVKKEVKKKEEKSESSPTIAMIPAIEEQDITMINQNESITNLDHLPSVPTSPLLLPLTVNSLSATTASTKKKPTLSLKRVDETIDDSFSVEEKTNHQVVHRSPAASSTTAISPSLLAVALATQRQISNASSASSGFSGVSASSPALSSPFSPSSPFAISNAAMFIKENTYHHHGFHSEILFDDSSMNRNIFPLHHHHHHHQEEALAAETEEEEEVGDAEEADMETEKDEGEDDVKRDSYDDYLEKKFTSLEIEFDKEIDLLRNTGDDDHDYGIAYKQQQQLSPLQQQPQHRERNIEAEAKARKDGRKNEAHGEHEQLEDDFSKDVNQMALVSSYLEELEKAKEEDEEKEELFDELKSSSYDVRENSLLSVSHQNRLSRQPIADSKHELNLESFEMMRIEWENQQLIKKQNELTRENQVLRFL